MYCSNCNPNETDAFKCHPIYLFIFLPPPSLLVCFLSLCVLISISFFVIPFQSHGSAQSDAGAVGGAHLHLACGTRRNAQVGNPTRERVRDTQKTAYVWSVELISWTDSLGRRPLTLSTFFLFLPKKLEMTLNFFFFFLGNDCTGRMP
jgi:hypothetical protein